MYLDLNLATTSIIGQHFYNISFASIGKYQNSLGFIVPVITYAVPSFANTLFLELTWNYPLNSGSSNLAKYGLFSYSPG